MTGATTVLSLGGYFEGLGELSTEDLDRAAERVVRAERASLARRASPHEQPFDIVFAWSGTVPCQRGKQEGEDSGFHGFLSPYVDGADSTKLIKDSTGAVKIGSPSQRYRA